MKQRAGCLRIEQAASMPWHKALRHLPPQTGAGRKERSNLMRVFHCVSANSSQSASVPDTTRVSAMSPSAPSSVKE
jgi:hypothetical protein